MQYFGEKLKALRKSRGISQSELAEEIFVSRSAVAKWEQGRGFPNIDSLRLIAQKFGMPVDALLNDGETELAQTKAHKKPSLKAKILTAVFPLVCAVAAAGVAFAVMFTPRSMYNYISLSADSVDAIYVSYAKGEATQTKYLDEEYYGEFISRVKSIKVVPGYKTFKARTEITYYLESGGKLYYVGKHGAGQVGKGKKFSIYSGDFYLLLELFGLETDDSVIPSG